MDREGEKRSKGCEVFDRPDPLLDAVCFHAQQCAEKYLKAFLTYKEIEFRKTHDLGELIALASKIDSSFEEIIDIGEKLTDYAVDVRYPLLLPILF